MAKGTLGAANDELDILLSKDTGTVAIDITGTFVATVAFEASPNWGKTWVAINGDPLATGAGVSTATAPGTFRSKVAGMTNFRARCSVFTSGSVIVETHESLQIY